MTNGLYHSDNTAAFEAAMTAQCNAAIASLSGSTVPRIMIPPGGNYALAFMPKSPCGNWNIESYGALWMSDGLGMDIPPSALWLGRATQNSLSPAGNGFSSSVSGTIDSGSGNPTIDDVVVMHGGSQTINGLDIPAVFDGIDNVNGGSVNVQNIYVHNFASGTLEGCGLRITGQNIGPNIYGPGVLQMTQDTTGVGSVCVDGSIWGSDTPTVRASRTCAI